VTAVGIYTAVNSTTTASICNQVLVHVVETGPGNSAFLGICLLVVWSSTFMIDGERTVVQFKLCIAVLGACYVVSQCCIEADVIPTSTDYGWSSVVVVVVIR
jgi:hypothetical protein